MTEVRLYGHLGREFGRIHHFDIETVAEVVSALDANFPGFRRYLVAHPDPGYRVILNGAPLTYEQLAAVVDLPSQIKIVPVVHGRGDGKGIGMIIGGVLLAAVSFGVGAAAAAVGSTAWGLAASIGASVGLGMASVGVSSLLSPQRSAGEAQTKEAERKRQYAFSSSAGNIAQGVPMPIRFGRQVVEGYPISVRLVVVTDVG
jgi:predicted phage tail protein